MGSDNVGRMQGDIGYLHEYHERYLEDRNPPNEALLFKDSSMLFIYSEGGYFLNSIDLFSLSY